MRTFSQEQKSNAAAIYRTCFVDTQAIRVDIERSLVANSFVQYATMGGLLTSDINYYRLCRCFPRGL